MKNKFIVGRETKADYLFNMFFGTAIVTVLGIRGFLAITNYPQLGGDNLHIAHMLWGGLFMIASIVSLLYFHGFRSKFVAAILAGIGFGFFIDELGKFITSDNDYFYQPTAMLIYVLFVILWAILSKLARYRAVTPQENAVDAFSKLRDVMLYGLSDRDAPMLRSQLLNAGCSSKEADRLITITKELSPTFDSDSIWQKLGRFGDAIHLKFEKFAYDKRTKLAVLSVFIFYAFMAVFVAVSVASGQYSIVDVINIPESTPAFIVNGMIFCLFLTTLCVAIGVINFVLRRSHNVFLWYRRALLINIFGTYVFLFYTNQFQAAFGLILNLLLFVFVNELANHTKPKPLKQ